MVNWFARRKVAPIHVLPGDSIRLTYNSPDRTEHVETKFEKAGSYDTMAIGEIENELGFANGLVAVIGNTKDA